MLFCISIIIRDTKKYLNDIYTVFPAKSDGTFSRRFIFVDIALKFVAFNGTSCILYRVNYFLKI